VSISFTCDINSFFFFFLPFFFLPLDHFLADPLVNRATIRDELDDTIRLRCGYLHRALCSM
jgi:hypothetical protein